MHSQSIQARTGQGSRWMTVYWSAAAVLLLLPAVAMRFTDEVAWSGGDFVIAAVLLGGLGLGLETMLRNHGDRAYRAASVCALGGAFLLLWINGAVGILGASGNAANLMFFGVLAVAAVGAMLARFEPVGMSRTMAATAAAQTLVAAIALTFDRGAGAPIWPRDLLGATAFFVLLWMLSASLFHKAGSRQAVDVG